MQKSRFKELEKSENPFPNNASFERPLAPNKVEKIVRIDDKILILFGPEISGIDNSNVYAYDLTGKLIWKVEPPVPDDRASNSYVYLIWSEDEQRIILVDFMEEHFYLDENTGKTDYMGMYGEGPYFKELPLTQDPFPKRLSYIRPPQPQKIQRIAETRSELLILFEPQKSEPSSPNLYIYAKEGYLLWSVEPLIADMQWDEHAKKVVLTDHSGRRFLLNLESRSIAAI